MNPFLRVALAAQSESATWFQHLWDLLGALHPAMVHFPVAAIMMAAGALVLRWKLADDLYDAIARFCLFVAASTAVVAALMGWALAPRLGYVGVFAMGSDSQWTLLLHRWTGILLAVLIGVSAILARVAMKRAGAAIWWKAGVFAAALLAGFVGHLGGSLTFGDLLPKALARAWCWELNPLCLQTRPAPAVPVPAVPPDSTAPTVPPGPAVDFSRDIRPILELNCLSCHGAKKQKSGYRLDTRDLAFAGGETCETTGQPAVVPGQSAASRLVWMISALEDDAERDIYPMPPQADKHLTPQQIQAVRDWIDGGAPWPEGLVLEVPE